MLFQVQGTIDPAPESNWPTILQKRCMVGAMPCKLFSTWLLGRWNIRTSLSGTSARFNVQLPGNTFPPVCGTQAVGLWRHPLSVSAWDLGTQSMDPIAHTQPTLLLPLLHSLEPSGNWNCWLKINPLVLAKAQTSKVLPFHSREWTYFVRQSPEFQLPQLTCLPNTSVCLN